MPFWKSSPQPQSDGGATTSSTAAWQSIATDSTTLSHPETTTDGSGFLQPESDHPSMRESEWSKERTSQQLELEDVHTHQRTGCCRSVLEFLVKALHGINISLGTAMIIYGSLLLTQFDEPAMAAVLFCLILGIIHFTTSLLGIVSLFSKGCSRFGLSVSAYVGPYVALVYLTIVISLAVDSSGFLQYLDDHKEVMYLGSNVAENCRKLMPLFYTILIALGILEASRFSVMLKLQERLLQRDAADTLIPRSSHHDNISAVSSSGSNALTEALLQDNETDTVETGGGGGHGKETTGTPNWWDK